MLIDEGPSEDSEVEAEACGVIAAELEHILIIDDDPTQTDILSHLLSRQGYRVSTALTCEEGNRKAALDRLDLILLDISLPDGSGLDLCSEFTDSASTADVPVILVSGHDESGIVRRARAAGCQYFVHKPYDPNALLVLIQNAISESRDWQLSNS